MTTSLSMRGSGDAGAARHSRRSALGVVLRAGLILAAVDAIQITITVWPRFHGSSFARVFSGVAARIIGFPEAVAWGAWSVVLGFAVHICVAIAWTAIFWLISHNVEPVQRAMRRVVTALPIAIIYGAFIWLMMDYVVETLIVPPPTPAFSPVWNTMIVEHMLVIGPCIVFVLRWLEKER